MTDEETMARVLNNVASFTENVAKTRRFGDRMSKILEQEKRIGEIRAQKNEIYDRATVVGLTLQDVLELKKADAELVAMIW